MMKLRMHNCPSAIICFEAISVCQVLHAVSLVLAYQLYAAVRLSEVQVL